MELRRWLVSEIVAPTLTLSAFCDTEFGSVLQRRVPDRRIAELPISQFHQVTIRAHSLPRQSTLSHAPML
jgi:hypothetical protein